jgi:hypothetical protein
VGPAIPGWFQLSAVSDLPQVCEESMTRSTLLSCLS